MKRNVSLKLRCITAVFALVIIVTGAPVAVAASGNSTVMPRYNNVTSVTNYFGITTDGTANVQTVYKGITGITTGTTVEIQLQRKTLLWWSDVDGGYWNNTVMGTNGSVSKTLQLAKTGEYRAVFKITVIGIGGANDVIEETLTYEY